MADRFQTLATGARDIIAAVDQSGCLTYVSPSVQPTLGLDPADVVGSVLWELVHPDDVVGVHTMLTHLFRDGGTKSIEFQMLGATGRWHRLDAIVQLVEGGAPVEAVLSATDVTERRQVEAALREREGQLRQARKMEVVGRLAGGISHDFGNLLTVIIGETGKMLDDLPADSPLRPHAESIRHTAERAGSIVRQLLSFSRQRSAALAVLDLNEVMDDAEQLLGRLLGAHIALRIIRGRDLWTVKADRTQIEQVLLNLAVNARDAMPSGGSLTIELMNVADEGVSAYGIASGQWTAVSVTDTGVGMDSATRARAFDPFFTTKAAGDGTGFGLATVHNIIQESGGWTHIASSPGRGTCVTFGLPRTHDVSVPVPPPGLSVQGGTETLLLVEDEEGVRELVRDMLTIAGYRVLEASAPSHAEQISHDCGETIHLLLTDVVMPEMSGVELSTRIRTHRPGLRVMFMSGFPDPSVGDGISEAPGAHFIAKPFDRQKLLRSVRRALDATEPA